MDILFYHHNRYLRSELQEFLSDLKGQPHFADSVESAITILNAQSIDTAFLEIRGLADIRLIQYINQYHRGLRTMLVVENELEEAIAAIREGGFGVMRAPLGLGAVERFISNF